MAILDASAFAMMSALRDQIEFRITTSEDFRALVALNRELLAYEARWVGSSPSGTSATERTGERRIYPRLVCEDRP